jgi:2-iminobutanoate/2-iminopropanoate deaminase
MAMIERIVRAHMKPLLEPYGLVEAARHGDTLTIAGTTGINAQHQVVEGGLKAQARQAFANIAEILGTAGATGGNLVHLTWYLVETEQSFLEDAFMVTAAREEVFPGLQCGQTAVRVKALLTPEILIEIQGTAAL